MCNVCIFFLIKLCILLDECKGTIVSQLAVFVIGEVQPTILVRMFPDLSVLFCLILYFI